MTNVAPQTEELLRVSEVAQALRVDDTTVRRWIKNGVLEAISLPHLNKRQAYRIRRETLDKLVNGQHSHTSHNGHNHHSHIENLEAVAV